jgi:hypothetical protein
MKMLTKHIGAFKMEIIEIIKIIKKEKERRNFYRK